MEMGAAGNSRQRGPFCDFLLCNSLVFFLIFVCHFSVSFPSLLRLFSVSFASSFYVSFCLVDQAFEKKGSCFSKFKIQMPRFAFLVRLENWGILDTL